MPHDLVSVGDKLIFVDALNRLNVSVYTGDETYSLLPEDASQIDGIELVGEWLRISTNRSNFNFVSDLSENGTKQVTRNPIHLVEGKMLYFDTAELENVSRRVLVIENLETGSTQTLTDFPSTSRFSLSILIESDDAIYFSLTDEFNGDGPTLWRTDGTAQGTAPVEDLELVGFDWQPPVILQDNWYFIGDDGVHGRELFRLPTKQEPSGDFDGSGTTDADDIDALLSVVNNGEFDPSFNLNDDDNIDFADLDVLIENILNTKSGDTNLDGTVDFADFLILSTSFGRENTGWVGGDFNGDKIVDFADFLLLADNFGRELE